MISVEIANRKSPMILRMPSERGTMSEKLKPVRCGCGGEAQYEAYENYNFGSYIAHIMICDKCGMRTAEWPSEAEAIEAWNRAMGERTAKVQELPRRSETSLDWEGKCSNCGAYTNLDMNYCHNCGAKLDWGE